MRVKMEANRRLEREIKNTSFLKADLSNEERIQFDIRFSHHRKRPALTVIGALIWALVSLLIIGPILFVITVGDLSNWMSVEDQK